MSRHRAIAAGLGAAVLALGVAGAAEAQLQGDSVRQRYDKSQKSTSIDEHVKKLDSDDPDERLDGVRAIGSSKDGKGVEYLIQALGDPDERVQVKAIEMLGEMRASDATPVLVQHLFIRQARPELKARILAALGKIGDATAARPIVEFLQRDLDKSTRGTAIYALGDIGAAEASPELKKIAETDGDPMLRRLAREALSKVQYHQEAQEKEVKAPLDTFLPKEPPPPPQ